MMAKGKKNAPAQVKNSFSDGKRGFTLVELVVALALLAILTTMIVTFSVLVSGFAKNEKQAYAFSEDCTEIKDAVTDLVRATDGELTVYTVGVDGMLTVNENGTAYTVRFEENVLFLGDTATEPLDTVGRVAFTQNGTLIKCTVWEAVEDGEEREFSFVLAPRLGSVSAEVTSNA